MSGIDKLKKKLNQNNSELADTTIQKGLYINCKTQLISFFGSQVNLLDPSDPANIPKDKDWNSSFTIKIDYSFK